MAAIKTHIQRIIRFPEKNPIIKESRLGLSVLTESSVVKTFFKRKRIQCYYRRSCCLKFQFYIYIRAKRILYRMIIHSALDR